MLWSCCLCGLPFWVFFDQIDCTQFQHTHQHWAWGRKGSNIIQLLRMSVYLSNTGMPNYSLRPFSIWYVRCGCMLRYVLLTSSARSLNHPSLLRSSTLKLGDGGFIFSVLLKFLIGEACFHLHSFRLDASCARLISAFGGFCPEARRRLDAAPHLAC